MSSPLDAIRQQLRQAAEAFSTDAQAPSGMLGAMVDDLELSHAREVVIFPVRSPLTSVRRAHGEKAS
ncbi:MAG: hypothetical protein U0165_09945 [Polyangiaceae bacterium]